MNGSDYAFPAPLNLREGAETLLEAYGGGFKLDQNDFVFFGQQGYQYLFFRATDSTDPPVFLLDETGEPREVSPHFSEWLRHEAEEEKAIVQLSGIAGWLLFPALATLLTPLWFLKDIIEGVSIISNVTGPINKDAVLNLAFALAVDIAFVAGWIVAIVFLFKHKRAFPKLFIGLTVAMLLNNVAGIFLGDTPLPDDRILVIARPVLTLAIWGTYLLVSKRSRSTFVN